MLVDLFQKTRESSKRINPQRQKSDGLTCKKCGAELSPAKYGKNLYVCPNCGAHARLLARTRIRQIADKESFSELFDSLQPLDPLGENRYE